MKVTFQAITMPTIRMKSDLFFRQGQPSFAEPVDYNGGLVFQGKKEENLKLSEENTRWRFGLEAPVGERK